MGLQIVKQPNGKYAIWSTNTDDFTAVDCDGVDDIVEVFMEYDRASVESSVKSTIERLEQGKKPYHQFTKTFDECVGIIRELHGEESESMQMLGLWRPEDPEPEQ